MDFSQMQPMIQALMQRRPGPHQQQRQHGFGNPNGPRHMGQGMGVPGNTGIVPPHMNPSPVPMPRPDMQHMGPGSGLAPMPGRLPDGRTMPNATAPRPMNPAGIASPLPRRF